LTPEFHPNLPENSGQNQNQNQDQKPGHDHNTTET
jgi:hypothetical protein